VEASIKISWAKEGKNGCKIEEGGRLMMKSEKQQWMTGRRMCGWI
jgi:hypothetical protein